MAWLGLTFTSFIVTLALPRPMKASRIHATRSTARRP
jgi:hypothetical protein